MHKNAKVDNLHAVNGTNAIFDFVGFQASSHSIFRNADISSLFSTFSVLWGLWIPVSLLGIGFARPRWRG